MSSETEQSQTKLPQLPFWLFLVAVTIAELLTALVFPLAGLICHGVILVVVLVSSALLRDEKAQNFLVSFSLIPMIRIVSLSMPLAKIPLIYWYILIYAPLLGSTIVVMWILRMKPRDIGLVKKGLGMYIPLGIILGMAVGLLEWFVLRPKPIVSAFTVQAILPAALILFFTTGLVEELIFRGVLQKTSEVFLGWRGLVYISVAFAILHIGQLSVLEVFFVFAIAMCFAWIVKWSGSLIVVIIAHGITNIILYLIAGFLLT